MDRIEEMPPEFWQGVEQFNQGDYYACHDTLEALWIEAMDPPKGLYQGLLQIAVACYHLGNQNWRGAVILLGEGMRRVEPYEPEFAGLDLDDLLTTSLQLLEALQQAGPEQVEPFSTWIQAVSAGGGTAPPGDANDNARLPPLTVPRLRSVIDAG